MGEQRWLENEKAWSWKWDSESLVIHLANIHDILNYHLTIQKLGPSTVGAKQLATGAKAQRRQKTDP